MARRRVSIPTGDKRKNIAVYILVIAILSAFALMRGRAVTEQQKSAENAEFQVHVIDVGQGDSILVVADGHAMLIDAAESKASGTILRYLEGQGITSLDVAAATHLHADHIGGFPAVLEKFPPKKCIESDCPEGLLPTSKVYEQYLDAVEASGAEYTVMQAGDTFQLGGATVEALAPMSQDAKDLNDTSLVLRVTYQDVVCLFTGDMERGEEQELLAQGNDLHADFLKVGHHGSDTSSGEDFLAAVQPRYAAISCGIDNSYGHPAQVTLDHLSACAEQVFVTAQDGNILFLYDADTGTSQIVTRKTASS